MDGTPLQWGRMDARLFRRALSRFSEHEGCHLLGNESMRCYKNLSTNSLTDDERSDCRIFRLQEKPEPFEIHLPVAEFHLALILGSGYRSSSA
jgi:hypothetical protein